MANPWHAKQISWKGRKKWAFFLSPQFSVFGMHCQICGRVMIQCTHTAKFAGFEREGLLGLRSLPCLHAQAALPWEHGAGSAWWHQTATTAFFAGPPCHALSALTRPLTPFSRVNAQWHFFIALEIRVMPPWCNQPQQMLSSISSCFYSDVISGQLPYWQ